MSVQGQGAGTHQKQVRFFHSAVLSMSIFTSMRRFDRYPFWLFDGNCGGGRNHDVGVIGSPLVAHLAADEAKLSEERRRFFFCDINRDRIDELARVFSDEYPRFGPCSYLMHGDNEGALLTFAERVRMAENPRFAIGLVLVDPNGWFYRTRDGEGPPTTALIDFARQFERMDILLNLNFRSYWLNRGKGFDQPSPREVLASLSRKHWLIGRIMVGQGRFFVAIGRNVATGDHRANKMFHLESEDAQAILKEIEGGAQRDFFDELPKLSGIPRAPGLPGGEDSGASAG